MKCGVTGRGTTPDNAPIPTRLIESPDTQVGARQRHEFLTCCKSKASAVVTLALYLSRRTPSARADLSSDKERLGSGGPLRAPDWNPLAPRSKMICNRRHT